MTDQEKQAITEHLATKVLGWAIAEDSEMRVDWGLNMVAWHLDGKFQAGVDEFNPLDEPSDCSLVMEAWRKLGCAWAVLSTFNHDGYANATAWRSNGSMEHVTWDDKLTSWPEAVCLAIARASGWEK